MAFTNSSLVSYTKISPNQSGVRNQNIYIIVPHCVVGQCSVEALGAQFQKVAASANYGIGADGRVGMYVPESNRSWCTSSSWVDNRGVTIECASDATAPYAFKDVVYNRLIELCVDICRRNGKTKLIWLGDKNKTVNYTPASNEMLLAVHRWFENKSCPGDWMYARMGDLAAKVTAKLGGISDSNASSGTAETKKLVVFDKWREYRNGGTPEPVYKDTDRATQTGTLNPGESCWCTGYYGDSYCVIYKLDGTADDWAVGYVKYNGGITD